MSDIEKRRTKIIMAVDDSAEVMKILQAVIERHGYTFIGASSGAECLSLACRLVPRVMLLDLQMPGMDGFEICRRLRGNPAFQYVPIIFLTATKTGDAVRAGILAGGNDFLIKPCDPHTLTARLDHWAGRRV